MILRCSLLVCVFSLTCRGDVLYTFVGSGPDTGSFLSATSPILIDTYAYLPFSECRFVVSAENPPFQDTCSSVFVGSGDGFRNIDVIGFLFPGVEFNVFFHEGAVSSLGTHASFGYFAGTLYVTGTPVPEPETGVLALTLLGWIAYRAVVKASATQRGNRAADC